MKRGDQPVEKKKNEHLEYYKTQNKVLMERVSKMEEQVISKTNNRLLKQNK